MAYSSDLGSESMNQTIDWYINTKPMYVLMMGAVIDPDEPADTPLFLYESTGCGDLAVRHGRLHPRQFHALCHGALLALRVEQPSPLQRRQRRGRESILHLQQFLVHYRNFPPSRIRTQSQGLIKRKHTHTKRRQSLKWSFIFTHHFILHKKRRRDRFNLIRVTLSSQAISTPFFYSLPPTILWSTQTHTKNNETFQKLPPRWWRLTFQSRSIHRRHILFGRWFYLIIFVFKLCLTVYLRYI